MSHDPWTSFVPGEAMKLGEPDASMGSPLRAGYIELSDGALVNLNFVQTLSKGETEAFLLLSDGRQCRVSGEALRRLRAFFQAQVVLSLRGG